MAIQTFNFSPDYGASVSFAPEIVENHFGDGYRQARAKGLNHNLRTYSLTFSRKMATIQTIDNFLKSHGGYIAFNWTPQSGTTGLFICKKWSITQQQGFAVLSAEFQEVIN